ncbi:Gfo/Idh/MocA family oxidoreductase [Clostridium sp. YIM B02505]|uniref:Gfo/Idh/MocA family oxidoreductase n=1 Tax=Clostridium yunnanense TaxID=2800325 RepID=A0ABS1ENJ4_9CLOT|nr:Gfo/Idh/MocA family oxidoreductase [Clostridium yunnanense]MBK1810946.1 Gfo/Idh/MocA family oxidoreductase [Clostridium yunnanense]
MRIGVIGLGGIAQKAYLPVITAREDIELVFCTRNIEKLKKQAKKYRVNEYTTSIDDLINSNIQAAFVHTATESHFEICKKLLMSGIHVYVDKPISYSYEESKELVNIANKYNRTLMIGFNRRFAPMYSSIKNEETANVVLVQKNRVSSPQDIRTFILDDYIHVLDTARFLMGGSISDLQVNGLIKNDKLYNVVTKLSNKNTTSIAIMNRDSGISEELVEYMCPGKKIVVKDMAISSNSCNNEESLRKLGDWDTTLYRKGFYQIINHFIDCIKDGKETNISLEDALLTHKICEDIIEELIKL